MSLTAPLGVIFAVRTRRIRLRIEDGPASPGSYKVCSPSPTIPPLTSRGQQCRRPVWLLNARPVVYKDLRCLHISLDTYGGGQHEAYTMPTKTDADHAQFIIRAAIAHLA